MGGWGWLKTSYGGGGWLKTPEYRHIGGRRYKIAKKHYILFERSLSA